MAATYSSLVGFAIGGKYEVRRVIGAGGMGVVCEATHLDLGKRVAVKLIDKSMKESESIVARFRREAKAAGRIQSEHIVDVFDVNADPRVGLYMVMEHLSGEDLQARLERDKRLDVKTSVMIAHQIARGLAKAHEAGVIHRDLKPANVFLTQRDNGQLLVKLLDFGVSKLLREEAGDSRITGSGTPIGTPLYMSPEQAEGKDDVDGRADLWSLGAVLYEALAGAPPFADRGSYHATIVGILTSRPKLLQDAAPWVPAGVAKVVDAMLVHDRDARIATAGEVTQRLLDAYPTVLPDGTGRHTAVIIPQAQAAFDETGDTEIFASTGATPFRVNTPSAPPEDSTKTVPFVESAERGSGDARSTAAATPIDYAGRASAISDPPHSPPVPSGVTSSSQGVSLPETPPRIEPLPPSELAPETTRDQALAVRAERRRRLSKALLLLVVLAVAVGGYAAGRRASTAPAPSNASAPEPPPATATAIATATATATATAAPTATVEPSAEPAPVVPSPPPSAVTPPKRKAAPPKAAAPRSSEPDELTPYDEQPPAPPPPEAPPAY